MTILSLQRRLHEAGRIRIGDSVPTSNGKRRPVKLDAFRFTSRNRRAIEAVAGTYGGTVQPWAEAPGGEQWQVVTEAAEIPVVVPPESMSFTQHYELWSGGGCRRRCDGDLESISGGACICDPDNRECKPHTRLSLMLAAYPGTGLWRIDTSGYYAAVELGGAMEVAAMLTATVGRSVLPGTLRLEHRTVKRPDQPPNNFIVPVLDFAVDMAALATGTAAQIAGAPARLAQPTAPAELGPGVTPVPAEPAPPLAAQIAAVQESEPRQRRANSAPELPPTGHRRRGSAAENAGPGSATEPAPPGSAQDTKPTPSAPASSRARRTSKPKSDAGETPSWCKDLHARATALALTDQQFDAVVLFVTNDRTSSPKELVAREAGQVNEALTALHDGELVLTPTTSADGEVTGFTVDPKF